MKKERRGVRKTGQPSTIIFVRYIYSRSFKNCAQLRKRGYIPFVIDTETRLETERNKTDRRGMEMDQWTKAYTQRRRISLLRRSLYEPVKFASRREEPSSSSSSSSWLRTLLFSSTPRRDFA